MSKQNKEFLYVGHYIDKAGNYILKVGTTKHPEQRAKEHTRNYARASKYTMREGTCFEYDQLIPLSHLNTLRYEEKTRDQWKNEGIGTFIRNDRFLCEEKPKSVRVTIRKTYIVEL